MVLDEVEVVVAEASGAVAGKLVAEACREVVPLGVAGSEGDPAVVVLEVSLEGVLLEGEEPVEDLEEEPVEDLEEEPEADP